MGELPEFIETEPNSLSEQAERVATPVVINGQIAGERDQDFFVFQAKAGDVVVSDILAARIGSPLDPIVTFTDSHGARMRTQEVRVGSDPVLAFKALETGDYRLHIANLGFGGGPAYVYRITLSTAAYAPLAFPPAARVGETRMLDLYTLSGNETFRIKRLKTTFPRTPGPFSIGGVAPLLASEDREVVEASGNQSAPKAMELTLPVTVSGRFSTAHEDDWYAFQAKKGETVTIACRPFPSDSRAMPVLTLLDDQGRTLASANTVDAPDRAIELDWTAPADGRFRLRLRDLQGATNGGSDFIYRLTVRLARPDFALRLEPDFVNVAQGGKTEVDLIVHRSGGFTGPIDLKTAGLPDGVQMKAATIPSDVSRLKLTLTAKDDARPTDVMAHLVGRANINGGMIERPALVSSIGREGTELFLTVQHKPLFRLTCNEAYKYAHRGTVYPYALTIERLNGFHGPIILQLCDRQVQDLDGIRVVESVVPAGAKNAAALVYLPETMHASVQHHSRPYVQGYATFVDRWGQKQTVLAVCEKRCMIRTLPPVVQLHASARNCWFPPTLSSPASCLWTERPTSRAQPTSSWWNRQTTRPKQCM